MSTSEKNIPELDVRVFIPIQRHEKLLKMFKELPVGESFIFINDHDPMPLYYEFRSIHGEVVGWEYLSKGGTNWKVKVTRTDSSKGREFTDISTLMDLRKVDQKDWKHVVFHRYGMMKENDTMELIAAQNPKEIQDIFNDKFSGQHQWTYKKEIPGEFVVHITKKSNNTTEDDDIKIVQEFDVRPFHSAVRHDMFFEAFAKLNPGEAFIFTNDHDPKPLYYQIEAESKQPFTWEYLIAGPDDWKVKVSKTNN